MNRMKIGKLFCVLAAVALILGIVLAIGHWMDEKDQLDQNNAVRQQVIDYANMQIGTVKTAKKTSWSWLSPAYDTIGGGYDRLIADAHEAMREDFYDALGRTAGKAVPLIILSALLTAGGLILQGKLRLRKREE